MKRVDYRALAEFRYQIRRFLKLSERAARAAKLEPQQHQLLLAMKGLPGGAKPTIRSLAERLQVQHHSAVELVDRLEERGLVRRWRGREDHREVIVRISPRGERLLRQLSLHHRALLRSAGASLVRALESLLPDGERSRLGGVGASRSRGRAARIAQRSDFSKAEA